MQSGYMVVELKGEGGNNKKDSDKGMCRDSIENNLKWYTRSSALQNTIIIQLTFQINTNE